MMYKSTFDIEGGGGVGKNQRAGRACMLLQEHKEP